MRRVKTVPRTYIKKPSSLNVSDEIEGKMAESVSPKSTIRATLRFQLSRRILRRTSILTLTRIVQGRT